ncbi:methionine synthase [Chloroflexota bacterium]
MTNTEFNCLPTMIGSMPHADAGEACALVRRFLKDIPAWPQLPRRSFLENMYVQYSQGFPNVVVDAPAQKIFVDNSADYSRSLEALYAAYLAEDALKFPVGEDYAAGLHRLLGMTDLSPRVAKGQITGPVTWGLTVPDDTGKAIIYHDILGDAVPKLLKLKAAWQEQALSRIARDTIIFIDEPYMSAYGSVGMNLSKEKIASLEEEVLEGIQGLKGIHCCGNTDWSILLETSADIISFDAYGFAQSLSIYPDAVKKLIDRGGCVAWGIVPNEAKALAGETAASLKDRLEEAMAPFTREGVPFRQLIKQGLLTPSCGLDGLSVEAAERCLELLAELSVNIRKKYA